MLEFVGHQLLVTRYARISERIEDGERRGREAGGGEA